MPPIRSIKETAKKSIEGRWATAIGVGALLVSTFIIHVALFEIFATVSINFLNDYVAPIVPLILLIAIIPFFACPLLYGALRWFWFSSDGNDLPVSEVFCFFSGGGEYLKAVSLSFRIFLRIAGILILCFIPWIIVFIVSSPGTYELLDYEIPSWASSVWFLSGVLNVFGMVMSFILLLRYFAAPILMINDANVSPTEALNLSVIISKNAGGHTISFLAGYIGWFLLSFLVLPLIFTLPLFLTGYAVYCRSLINYYNETLVKKSGNYFVAPSGKI